MVVYVRLVSSPKRYTRASPPVSRIATKTVILLRAGESPTSQAACVLCLTQPGIDVFWF